MMQNKRFTHGGKGDAFVGGGKAITAYREGHSKIDWSGSKTKDTKTESVRPSSSAGVCKFTEEYLQEVTQTGQPSRIRSKSSGMVYFINSYDEGSLRVKYSDLNGKAFTTSVSEFVDEFVWLDPNA